MIAYHVIIAQERRTPARELAMLIDMDQLHSLGYALNNPDDPNLLYIAAWNQVDPWIDVLKGDNAVLKMRFAGWPVVTQAEYEAQQQAELPQVPAGESRFQGATISQETIWPDWAPRSF